MASDVHVDIQSLDSLDNAFSQASSSLSSLRGSVRAYMDNAVAQAQVIVRRFEAIEHQAQLEYDAASAAYSACLDRQRYDDETGEYRPSCNCEERDVNRAADKLNKARRQVEQARRCQGNITMERDNYLASPGGDRLFDSIDDKTLEARKRLALFREIVENHEAMEAGLTSISLGVATSSGHEATANMFREGVSRIQNSPVAKFREGMNRIKERQEEQQRLAIFRHLSGGDPNEHTR